MQQHSGYTRNLMLSRFSAALGNPTRIAILDSLASHEHCVKGDFLEIPGISRFTVGQNLKELKKYGLVNGSFTSKKITYCLDYDKLEEFKLLFDNFYNSLVKNRNSVNPENEICGNTLLKK